MNKELLNNPEVKEIAEKFALNKICKLSDIANSYDFDDFVREQTKPKEWEILQFTNKHNNVEWWNKQFTGDFRLGATDHYQSINQLLANENLQIKSVKRISDGEVFTVGDKTNCGKIKDFGIYGYNMVSKMEGGNGISASIIALEKAKQPLFKTEDGVDVFEGDEYFFIYPQYTLGKVNKADGLMNGALASLSTEQAAKDWILMNKPCLSVNDVMSFTLSESVHIKRLQEELTNLAKSKI